MQVLSLCVHFWVGEWGRYSGILSRKFEDIRKFQRQFKDFRDPFSGSTAKPVFDPSLVISKNWNSSILLTNSRGVVNVQWAPSI